MYRNRHALSTTVVKGSMLDVINEIGDYASALMDVEIVAIVDTSGSMEMSDGTGKSRYDRAVDELKIIQEKNPGKVLVISFSDQAKVCLNGIPHNYCEGTKVARGLECAREYDMDGIQFVLICDGQPDDYDNAIAEARKFTQPINTIYIGAEANQKARDFLNEVSGRSGGKAWEDKEVKLLSENVQTLLLGSGK